jgi:hypothetical protein
MHGGTLRFRLFALLVMVTVVDPGLSCRGGVRFRGRIPGVGCSSVARRVAASRVPADVVGRRSVRSSLSTRSARTASRVWTAALHGERFIAAPGRWSPEVARQVEGLERSARVADWAAVARSAAALRQRPDLAADLRESARRLEVGAGRIAFWQRFRLGLHVGWERPPDGIDEALDRAEAAGGAAARKELARYLGCRARLEGHAELARRLRGDERHDAQAVLRELRDLKLPAAAPTEPPPVPPLGLPVPEGSMRGFRPAVLESLGADLPMMQKLSVAEGKAREGVLREAERFAAPDRQNVQIHLSRLSPYTRHVKAGKEATGPIGCRRPPTRPWRRWRS